MAVFGWLVLALLFLVEVWAWAAYGVWGWQHDPRWLLVWLLPAAVIAIWALFASPKAKYGGHLVRPIVKVVVFAGAALALCDADHLGWAVAFAAFAVVIHALAQLPSIKVLAEQPED